MNLEYDVVIIGGGVAGTSAGITLLQRQGIRVAVVEKSDFVTHRIGESLSPGARPLLEYLKVWDRFNKEQSLNTCGSLGAWSTEELLSFDFLFTIHGSGWSLDRNQFDKMIYETFRERGGEVYSGLIFKKAVWNSNFWSLSFQDEQANEQKLTAKYVIDASGRKGVFANHVGSVRTVYDRLVGVCAIADIPEELEFTSNIMIEACEYGWWYSAPIPRRRVAAVLMSDADIINQLKAKEKRNWTKLMGEMPYTKARMTGVHFVDEPRVYSAISSVLFEPGGDNWLAVGDAAASHDPLSSSGIPNAIGSAIQGAITALDSLYKEGMAYSVYKENLVRDFSQYAKTHWQYYTQVQRWPDSPFWKRRTTKIQIAPESQIRLRKEKGLDLTMKPIHMPRKALNELLVQSELGMPVYKIVDTFKKAHPHYPDQQIILGFQELVENELLEVN